MEIEGKVKSILFAVLFLVLFCASFLCSIQVECGREKAVIKVNIKSDKEYTAGKKLKLSIQT